MNIAPVQRSARRTRKDVAAAGNMSSPQQQQDHHDDGEDVPQRHVAHHGGSLKTNSVNHHHHAGSMSRRNMHGDEHIVGVEVVSTAPQQSYHPCVLPQQYPHQHQLQHQSGGHGGYVLFPDARVPQFVEVPRRILHPNEEYAAASLAAMAPSQQKSNVHAAAVVGVVDIRKPNNNEGHGNGQAKRGHARRQAQLQGAASPITQRQHTFHFFHPVKKEHETTKLIEELSPQKAQHRHQQQQQHTSQHHRPVEGQRIAFAVAPPPPLSSSPLLHNGRHHMVGAEEGAYNDVERGGVGYNIPMASVMSVIPTPPRRSGGNSKALRGGQHNTDNDDDDGGGDGGERVSKHQKSDGTPAVVRGTNGCYQPAPSDALDVDAVERIFKKEDRQRRAREKQQQLQFDASPSPESQHHNNQFRRIAVEAKQVEEGHMAARKRRKQERRSFDHYEALHAQHADDWRRVCDSTMEMQQERLAIAELYQYDPNRPHRRLTNNKKPKPSAVLDYEDADDEDNVRMAQGDEDEDAQNNAPPRLRRPSVVDDGSPLDRNSSHYQHTTGGVGGSAVSSPMSAPTPKRLLDTQEHHNSPPSGRPQRGGVYDTPHVVLSSGGAVPLPPIFQQRASNHSQQHEQQRYSYDYEEGRKEAIRRENYSISKKDARASGAGGVDGVRRSTQDLISNMERRYRLIMEKDAREAEKRVQEDERTQRRLDEQLLEARHVIHQSMAKERRREEAKKKAEALSEERRRAVEENIQQRDMNTKYAMWRQGIEHKSHHQLKPNRLPQMFGGPRSGALQGFSNIARKNNEILSNLV